MNFVMIQRLVLKDWYFFRGPIAGLIGLGLIALVLISLPDSSSVYIGMVMLITVMIGGGIYLAMVTVIQERTEHNLPFVMSLPISPMEYTTAKILANLLIYSVLWIILVIGGMAVIAGSEAIPNGLMPFAAIILTEIFAGYCLILAVALISESHGWTIGVMAAANLFFNYFLYLVAHIPAIEDSMDGPVAVWDATVWWLLSGEVAVIGLLIGLTFYIQSRKKDFIC